jgi:flagellar protein FlaF
MQQQANYAQFTDLGGASPREAEILAFGLCNTRLAAAEDAKTRVEALHKNHQLWSMLVRDLASDGNRLPEDLKQQLIDLGFWAMRYGVLAACQDLPLAPLIAVNSNILEGLRGQEAGAGVANNPAIAPAARPSEGFAASA